MPADTEVYKSINLPVHSLFSVKGEFQGFKSLTTVSGEELRLPVFTVTKLAQFGRTINLIELEPLDQQFKDIDADIDTSNLFAATANLNAIIRDHPSDTRIAEYRQKVDKLRFDAVAIDCIKSIESGDYSKASQIYDDAKSLTTSESLLEPLKSKLMALGNSLLDEAEQKINNGRLDEADTALTQVSSASLSDQDFSNILSREKTILSELISKAKEPLLDVTTPSKLYYGRMTVLGAGAGIVKFKVKFLSRDANNVSTVRVEDYTYPQLYRTFDCDIEPINENTHTLFCLHFTPRQTDGVIVNSDRTAKEYNSTEPSVHFSHLFVSLLQYNNQTPYSNVSFTLDASGHLIGLNTIKSGNGMVDSNGFAIELSSDDPDVSDDRAQEMPHGAFMGIKCFKSFGGLPKGFVVSVGAYGDRNAAWGPFEETYGAGGNIASEARIITSFNGTKLDNLTRQQFRDMVEALPINAQVKFELYGWSDHPVECRMLLGDCKYYLSQANYPDAYKGSF